jgi:hypothetical protein
MGVFAIFRFALQLQRQALRLRMTWLRKKLRLYR